MIALVKQLYRQNSAQQILLLLVTFIVVYYPLSFEITVFHGVNSSQPKIFDLLYFLIAPGAFFAFWLDSSSRNMLNKFAIFSFLMVLLFVGQCLLVSLNSDYFPKLSFLLRYGQYCSYVVVFFLAIERFRKEAILEQFIIVSLLQIIFFILNSLIYDNPLNQNIIGTFRGSFDAGAYFVLLLCLLVRFRSVLKDKWGGRAFYLAILVTFCNLLLSSSRTAIVLGMLVGLRLVIFSFPVVVSVCLVALVAKNYVSIKIIKLFELLSLAVVNPAIIFKERSLEMRWENFIRYKEFIESQSSSFFLVLIGSGPGYFQRYVSLYGQPGTFDCYSLRVLSEYGLIGLFMFLGVVVLTARVSGIFAVVFFMLSLTSDSLVTSKLVPLIVFVSVIGFRDLFQAEIEE